MPEGADRFDPPQKRGKGTNNKRQRVDEQDEGAETEESAAEEADTAPRQLVKLPEGMRAAMGGRKFCAQDELTREVLLQYLKGKGEIREVAGLVEVTVQTMTGRSFDVVLESGASATVGQLKAEIEEVEGTRVHRQDLFVLCAEAEKGSEVPLVDSFVIAEACTVASCVAIKPGE